MAVKHLAVQAISDDFSSLNLVLYNDLLCSSFISSTTEINSCRQFSNRPTRILPFMFMPYHPTLAPSGPVSPEPPFFLAKPIPALPHRTTHNKLRSNLTIKLGTAGYKSSIICQATLKRNLKHHRTHSQFMRQPSLSVIPEQFEGSVPSTPALSRASSSSRLLPSLELVTPMSNILFSLFTKNEEKKGKLQAWWSGVGWSASRRKEWTRRR